MLLEYDCPAPIATVLARLPRYPGSLAFVAGLNLFLAPYLPIDALAMLEGHALRIEARDARVVFDFAWRDKRFHPLPPGSDPVLTISASVRDFILLMQRKEDPDTLFFSRRLGMEGNTELGLLVKNTLDALDLTVLPWARARGRRRAF